MEDFITRAPETMNSAKYSAFRERSVGLGVMGFHSFLQKKNTNRISNGKGMEQKNIFFYKRTS